MVAGRSLTIGDIGKIHRDFRERGQGLSGASVGIAVFSERWERGTEKTDMARKCHRQENGTHFIFVGEQFWGRAAPGVLNSKEFRALVVFWSDLFPSMSLVLGQRNVPSMSLVTTSRGCGAG